MQTDYIRSSGIHQLSIFIKMIAKLKIVFKNSLLISSQFIKNFDLRFKLLVQE